MKKCIIILNLLLYTTFLNQWNFTESHPTSSSSGTTDTVTTQEQESTDTKESIDTVTYVSIDIENTQSTTEFDYTDQSGVVTYTPKTNCLFKKVSKGTKDIWESTDDVCGTLVRTMTSNNVKYLAILLDNNMFTLFNEESGEWKDITSYMYDIKRLKFLGENDKELSNSDYSVTIVDLSFTYIFNTGVKCKKVTLGDEEVWKHTDDSKFAGIRSISLDLESNKFFVKNQSDEVKKIEKKFKLGQVTKPAETKMVEVKKATVTHVTKPVVTHVFLDINNTKDTDEFMYTDHNGVVTYLPKDDYLFDRVSKGSNVIWESTDVCSTLVRIKATNNVKYLAILLTNRMFTLFNEDGGEWKDITSKRHDVTKLKFLGESDSELKSSDYSVTIVDYSYRFLFNDGVKCVRITYNNVLLWKHNDDPEFGYLKGLYLDLLKDQFSIKNLKDQTKQLTKAKVTLDIDNTQSTTEFDYNDQNGVVTYKPKSGHVFKKVSQGTKDIWESKNDICGTLVRIMTSDGVKYLAILLDNNMFSLFNEESGEWQDITSKRHDIKNLKFFGENDKELSKTDYKVTIVDLSFRFIFNTGVKCKKIKYGDEEVWKHTDDTEFSEIKSFSLGLASNKFFVKNQSDETKELQFKTTPVTPVSVTTSETTVSDKSQQQPEPKVTQESTPTSVTSETTPEEPNPTDTKASTPATPN